MHDFPPCMHEEVHLLHDFLKDTLDPNFSTSQRPISMAITNIASDLFYVYLLLISFTAFLFHLFTKTHLKPNPVLKAPPSPQALPIIGHLHLIGSVLPKSLQTLARRHGPLMQLRLGTSSCVVVSNSDTAKEIFKTHELNFSSRPEFGSSEYFIYRGSRFITAQYGDYWRFMKKLCMTRLLAVPQLDRSIEIREQEVVKLLERVEARSREGKPCDLSSELTTLTNNTICRMVMSTRCSGSDNEAEKTKNWVKECTMLGAKLIFGDTLGPLRFLDFSGNGKKLVSVLKFFDQLVETIMKEHEANANGSKEDKSMDLMDILLEIYNDPNAELKLSRNDIKSFLLDILMAGTDTSSVAMQWAMGELTNHPQTLKKLREEIYSVVGPDKIVKESDIQNIPYLQAVIKETLRLHPSVPLAMRECAEDCKVNGCLVKAKSRVLVNVYAVMRDPAQWRDPEEFIPERFLETSEERIGDHQMEVKGRNFRYLPFGRGRRGCPGASLAMLVMQPTVGTLVQRFDWRVKDGDMVDLRQGSGFAAEMAKPLVCYPIRPIPSTYLN